MSHCGAAEKNKRSKSDRILWDRCNCYTVVLLEGILKDRTFITWRYVSLKLA